MAEERPGMVFFTGSNGAGVEKNRTAFEFPVQRAPPKHTPSKSFSALASLHPRPRLKIFRRASESLKSFLHPSKRTASEASHPSEPATLQSKHQQSDDFVSSFQNLLVDEKNSLQAEVHFPPSAGSAARAFAANANQMKLNQRSFTRNDSCMGLCLPESDRESGVSLPIDPYEDIETKSRTRACTDSTITRTDPFSSLPYELSVDVLSYLDAATLKDASLVSKRWSEVCKDQGVMRSCFLRTFAPSTSLTALPAPVGGKGIGRNKKGAQDWRRMYKARAALNANWKKGNIRTTYLHGHTDSVYCVQFDEDKIITGSRDRTIRVWDIHTHKCRKVVGDHRVLENDRRQMGSIANLLLENGASPTNSIVVSDPPDPGVYHTPKYYHMASILCLQYDDEIMVTGSSDSTLIVWNIYEWEPTHRLRCHKYGVLDLAFDKDKIVSCSKDFTLCVWNREDGSLLQQLYGHQGPVNAVQLRGNLVVSASGEGSARLWNLNFKRQSARTEKSVGSEVRIDPKVISEFWSRNRGLACVEFSDDGKHILAGGNDQVIFKYDTKTGELISQTKGHDGLVRSLYLDGSNSRIISGSYDLSIRVWDYESGEPVCKFPNWTTSWMLSAKSDYRRIVSTSQDGRVMILDFGNGVDGVELLEEE